MTKMFDNFNLISHTGCSKKGMPSNIYTMPVCALFILFFFMFILFPSAIIFHQKVFSCDII